MVAKPRVEDLAQLSELVVQGTIRPVIDRVYPLEEVRQAMIRAGPHQARGKLVIHVS